MLLLGDDHRLVSHQAVDRLVVGVAAVRGRPVPGPGHVGHVTRRCRVGTVAAGHVDGLGVGDRVIRDVEGERDGPRPTGTITFTVYDPNDAVAHAETVNVTGGNGTYSTPTGHVADVAGTWHWSAAYGGDANNKAVHSLMADEPVVVTQEQHQAQPSISTAPNPTSAIVGSTLNDTATLSGGNHPTGTITFTLYDPNDAVAYTETVNVTGGNGTYSTPTGHVADVAGTWHWSAAYE